MNRRSARLQARHPEPISITAEFDDDETYLPAPKRRRVSKAHGHENIEGRKKRGLERLPDMPLDILFEIFAHSHPLDLLHLGRSSKTLRALLFRKSSVTVWRRSLQGVEDLPSCPPQLAEPVYASILFDGVCQFCGTRTPNVLWKWFIRACKACAKRNLYTYPQGNDEYFSFLVKYSVATMIIDGEIEEETFTSMVNNENMARRTINKTAKKATQYLPTFTYPPEEYKRIVDTCAKDERETWAYERIWRMRDLEPFATACRRWQNDQNHQRSNQLDDIRNQRLDDIKTKLSEIGWAEEVSKLGLWSKNMLRNHNFARQPKTLTEREWLNHKDEMVDFMRMIKERRLRMQPEQIRNRLELLRNSMRRQRLPEVFPNLADIYLFQPIHSQLRHRPLWTHNGVYDYSHVMTELVALAAEWQKRKETELKLVLANRLDVNLAVVFFQCYRCTDPISFPRILVHDHITQRTVTPREEGYDPTQHDPHGMHSDWYDAMELNPWGSSYGRIQPHGMAMLVASSILSACGFDSMTTTREEIEEADPYVECLHPDCGRQKAMQWQRAILHGLNAHGQSISSWRLLSLAERVRARKLESPQPHYSFKAYRCAHACDLSSADRMTYEETMIHLNLKHQINEQHAQRGRDYSYHIDLDTDLAVPGVVESCRNISEPSRT